MFNKYLIANSQAKDTSQKQFCIHNQKVCSTPTLQKQRAPSEQIKNQGHSQTSQQGSFKDHKGKIYKTWIQDGRQNHIPSQKYRWIEEHEHYNQAWENQGEKTDVSVARISDETRQSSKD